MDLKKLPVWNEMQPITLEEMDSIRLMNRVDTKFLIREDLLPELLEKIKHDYRAQKVEGEQVCRYNTLYYDTIDAEMYQNHHNNKLNRQKVRARTYVESNISFLEVKRKNNKGRTTKDRIRIPNDVVDDISKNAEAMEFLSKNSTISGTEIIPQLSNSFDRITLVNNGKSERLTIDAHIHFLNLQTGIEEDAINLVVVELKQDGQCPSLFKSMLTDYKVLPKSFSKYALGSAMTNPNLKRNQFKNKLRFINKLTEIDDDTMY
ncbi:MAG TPA: polyphosphate polymerase domain-containing protein [Bacteroidales bacterium]